MALTADGLVFFGPGEGVRDLAGPGRIASGADRAFVTFAPIPTSGTYVVLGP